MSRLRSYLFLVALMAFFACEQIELEQQTQKKVQLHIHGEIPVLQDTKPYTNRAIDAFIQRKLTEEDEFKWAFADDKMIWSAAIQSDSIVSIGFQPKGFKNLDSQIHLIDMKAEAWQAVRTAIIDFVVEEERAKADDILVLGESKLPQLSLKISRFETIAKLRRIAQIRYVEPSGYSGQFTEARSIACSFGPSSNISTADYSIISPNAKLPWNFAYMNIPDAWDYSQGDNITVGLIDTGISPDQDKLNDGFDKGLSAGRFRDKTGFFVTGFWWWASIDGPDDDCGHGTGMAGTILAPRTNEGNTVGVAYKANLVSVRGTDDMVLDESREKDGVADALVYLADRGDVKIISMSLGSIFHSGQVADAVRYAHNKGKMVLAAAGTSTSLTNWWGVVFPANMDETVAITGVKTGSPLRRCSNCHSGSKVDFTIVMQDRDNNGRTALTLSGSGNTPKYTGGSSAATSTAAGIAALVWAQNTGMNRDQIIDLLKTNSSNYPNRDNAYGWGTIDALAAVQAAL